MRLQCISNPTRIQTRNLCLYANKKVTKCTPPQNKAIIKWDSWFETSNFFTYIFKPAIYLYNHFQIIYDNLGIILFTMLNFFHPFHPLKCEGQRSSIIKSYRYCIYLICIIADLITTVLASNNATKTTPRTWTNLTFDNIQICHLALLSDLFAIGISKLLSIFHPYSWTSSLTPWNISTQLNYL